MHDIGFEFVAMAGPGELRLVGNDVAALQAAADAAIAEVRRIETRYSRYRPDSIVSRINAAAGGAQGVSVDDETAALLDFAAQAHAASDGRFDITSGVLRRAWDFRAARRPSDGELAALQPLIGWERVEWRRPIIRLPHAGMELDFGGFGKEYAADRAAALLAEAGVAGGWVNLAGDLRVFGPRADGTPWRLGIAHPRRPGALLAEVELAQGGLATSGDYERFFERDGRRYAHLLDARTGAPVDGLWQSVSVVAPTCLAAGTLCTVALLHGPAAGARLQAEGVHWLGVDGDGRPHAPPPPEVRGA